MTVQMYINTVPLKIQLFTYGYHYSSSEIVVVAFHKPSSQFLGNCKCNYYNPLRQFLRNCNNRNAKMCLQLQGIVTMYYGNSSLQFLRHCNDVYLQ